MLDKCKEKDIYESGAYDILEPMLWSYAENLTYYLDSSTWMKLSLFKFVSIIIIIFFLFFIFVYLISLEIFGLHLHLKVLMVQHFIHLIHYII